jgi:hypothetical protein
MGGRGAPPGEQLSRERDQRRRDADLVVVVADGQLHGPELPALPEGCAWPDATVTWWRTWREAPQAALFTDTDWSFLMDTAMLHSQFWLGDLSVAAELRLRVAKFGATPEDRQRLKLAVGDPARGGAPPKTQGQQRAGQARRARLLEAVQEPAVEPPAEGDQGAARQHA